MSDGWEIGVAATRGAVRLFCFAHAGGGGSFFRPWRGELGPEVELHPVTLPGRENRIGERPHRRLDTVIESVYAELAELLDRPFALFGHSLGTLLAYEVARRVTADPERAGRLRCLFVSGRRAPHLPSRHAPLHGLPDAEFLERVLAMNGTPRRLLDEPELMAVLTRAMRADFEMNETYEPADGVALTCPVVAMIGDTDPEADLEEMAAWRTRTTGPFTLRVFRGDHFYLRGSSTDVVATVRADLRRTGRDASSARRAPPATGTRRP